MEQLTTYRAKGKKIGLVFLFKYDLNGHLRAFQIEEGELNEEQMNWLFTRFPANENRMKTVWMKDEKYTSVFSVEVSPADLSFDALWELYDYKFSKIDAIKAFQKLKEAEIIKCFLDVPLYKNHLKSNPTLGRLLLATYINKRRFDDERPITTSRFTNNPLIKDLAEKKTDK